MSNLVGDGVEFGSTVYGNVFTSKESLKFIQRDAINLTSDFERKILREIEKGKVTVSMEISLILPFVSRTYTFFIVFQSTSITQMITRKYKSQHLHSQVFSLFSKESFEKEQEAKHRKIYAFCKENPQTISHSQNGFCVFLSFEGFHHSGIEPYVEYHLTKVPDKCILCVSTSIVALRKWKTIPNFYLVLCFFLLPSFRPPPGLPTFSIC